MRLDLLIDIFFNWPLWVSSFPALLSGLKITFLLTGVTLVFAMAVGLLIALARHTRIRLLNWLFVAYVDTFRALPSLVLLVLIYFGLPFVGVKLDPYTSTIIALTVFNAAFISEVFRSGLQAVDRGQVEAARALGLTGSATMWFVVFPQASRIVLPPLTSNVIGLVKDTALASVVAVPELLREARIVQSIILNPSPLMLASLMYLAILVPLVRLVGVLEQRVHRPG